MYKICGSINLLRNTFIVRESNLVEKKIKFSVKIERKKASKFRTMNWTCVCDNNGMLTSRITEMKEICFQCFSKTINHFNDFHLCLFSFKYLLSLFDCFIIALYGLFSNIFSEIASLCYYISNFCISALQCILDLAVQRFSKLLLFLPQVMWKGSI